MAPVRCLLRFLFAGSRVLRRFYHSKASPGPILRALGQNALCSPHCSKHTFSKRPLFYHCTELSLPSLLPAKAKDQSQKLLLALRKSHSLPFSASPWIRPPDSSGIALTISIWPTAVVAVVGQCPPKASAPEFIFTFQMVLPWSLFKTNGFHPDLPEVSPNLLPFFFLLGPLFFWGFFKQKALSVSQPCSQPLCVYFRGPGGQGLGSVCMWAHSGWR